MTSPSAPASAASSRRRPVASQHHGTSVPTGSWTGRSAGFVLVPLVVLMLTCLAALALGARAVDPATTLQVLLGGTDGSAATQGIDAAAVLSRIPRTVTAVLVGAALGVTGAALQGATRNPLGDPSLLGLSAGAMLAVAAGLALGMPATLVPIIGLAAAGTLVAAVVVYAVAGTASRRATGTGGAPGPLSLVLAGAAITAGCTALTTALLVLFPAVLDRFRFWTVGSVARTSLEDAALLAPLILLGILVVVLCAPGLDALSLGDELAHGLGARPVRTRVLLLGSAVVLTAAAVALAGPVGFVGLMVPHALRRFHPPTTRVLVFGCALWGAVLLVAADLFGRLVVAPQEIHIGVTTVVLGVPVLLVLLRRKAVSL